MKAQQLPKNWQEVELKEICDIKKGSSITKTRLGEGNIPVIAGGQQPAYYHNLSNRNGETITVSGSGAYAGFVAYFNIPIFASDCSTIQAKGNNLFMKYLYYFLKYNQKQIYKMQKGIAQPHVYPKDLAQLKIPIPPLETQKAIVQILEKTESIKQKREQADKLTNDYLKSVFYEMFLNKKFEQIEIGNKSIFDVQSGGTPSKSKKEYWENGDIPWMGSTSCKDLPIYEAKKYITKKGLENSSTKIFPKETVLVALVGATIGKTGILKFNCSMNQNVAGIIIKNENKIDSTYLFFSMKNLYSKFISLSGDTFKMANLSFVRSLQIPLPPIPLQQKFASIVEHVEKLKEKQKQSKEHLEEMFNSLMQKAFNGELIK